MIAALVYSDEGYDEALALLEQRYGSEFRAYQAMLSEVHNLRTIKKMMRPA